MCDFSFADLLIENWTSTLKQNGILIFLLLLLIQQDNASAISSQKEVISSNKSWSQYQICLGLQTLRHEGDLDVYERGGSFCASYFTRSFTSFIKNVRKGNSVVGYKARSALSHRHHDQPNELKLRTGNAKMKSRTKLQVHKGILPVPHLGGHESPKFFKMQVTPVASTPTEEAHQNWTCVCEPGGLLGFQQYNTLVSQSFAECQCPSGCPLCPAGQVLNPFLYENGSCVCVSPLLLVVRLIEVSLETYTIQIEENLRRSIGLILHMPSSQVFPFARREGSVIVDNYIFSSGGATLSEAESRDLIDLILQSNQTSGGVLKDPALGQFTIVAYQNPTEASNLPIPSDSVRKKFLLPIILLSIIVGALLLLISVACIVFYLKKRHHDPRSILFDKEEKQQCFTSLMSHSSRSTEEFQIYDNSCFHMAAGCIGKQASRKVERPDPVLGMATQRYLYSELSDATGGFCESNLIGVGGSSMVYHGKLKDGRPVAVKRLNFFTGPEIEHEFLLEVELLSRLHHFHLVSLLGYCSEIKGKEIQRILVYDFMENGNLREHLSNVGNKTLNWDTRLQIAVGAARGLEYLHEAADPRVLHRDFKSQNILLDYKWRAKVADFGMAKVIESSDFTGCTNSPAQMLGTFGYLAPEYATTGKATTKSDVFSFGVVLLELISARQSLDILSPKGEQSLVQWALPMLHDREWVVNNLVDPELGHHCSSELVQQVALIAQACLQADPDLRPSMTSVVQALSRLLSKPTGDVETEISASPDTQILGKDSSSRYREPDLLDCSTITPERFNVRTTYPYVSMRDRDNDQKVVDVLSLDEDMRRQKSAVLRRTTSLSGAENFLGSGAILSPSNPIRRCFEEEALDLLKPRLEYFWLHGERMER